MGKLFEGFKFFYVCSDFDHILEKRGKTMYLRRGIIQGRILNKEIRYVCGRVQKNECD